MNNWPTQPHMPPPHTHTHPCAYSPQSPRYHRRRSGMGSPTCDPDERCGASTIRMRPDARVKAKIEAARAAATKHAATAAAAQSTATHMGGGGSGGGSSSSGRRHSHAGQWAKSPLLSGRSPKRLSVVVGGGGAINGGSSAGGGVAGVPPSKGALQLMPMLSRRGQCRLSVVDLKVQEAKLRKAALDQHWEQVARSASPPALPYDSVCVAVELSSIGYLLSMFSTCPASAPLPPLPYLPSPGRASVYHSPALLVCGTSL